MSQLAASSACACSRCLSCLLQITLCLKLVPSCMTFAHRADIGLETGDGCLGRTHQHAAVVPVFRGQLPAHKGEAARAKVLIRLRVQKRSLCSHVRLLVQALTVFTYSSIVYRTPAGCLQPRALLLWGCGSASLFGSCFDIDVWHTSTHEIRVFYRSSSIALVDAQSEVAFRCCSLTHGGLWDAAARPLPI